MDDSTPPPSFSTGRKFGAGMLVAIATVALLAIVVMVNFIAIRHYQQFAWGSDSVSRLSGVTKQVLKSLTNSVRITVLYSPSEVLYSHVVSMLREYGDISPKIAVEFVNPINDPKRADDIKVKYKLPQAAREMIIFESGGKIATVGQSALSDLDVSKLVKGESNEVKRKAFLGERFFTSRILEVTDSKRPKVYFTYQHREHDLENMDQADAYGKFVDILSNINAHAAAVKLTDTNEIPADCELLVIAGPRLPFSDLEVAKIEKYLRDRGGRLFLMFRSGTTTGLEKMMGNWGVDVGDDAVIDPPNSLGGRATELSVWNTGTHPTVRKVDRSNPLVLIQPRSLEKRKGGGPQGTDAPQVTELLKTGIDGISITNFSSRQSLEPAAGDRRGEITLAVAVVKGENQGVKLSATRIIATGDSYFLDNNVIQWAPNYQFAWDSINWLLDRSTLLEIAPMPFPAYHFRISQNQSQSLRLIVLGVVPGSILTVGLLVWLRRRI
jgi:hypothetical protein